MSVLGGPVLARILMSHLLCLLRDQVPHPLMLKPIFSRILLGQFGNNLPFLDVPLSNFSSPDPVTALGLSLLHEELSSAPYPAAIVPDKIRLYHL